MLLKPETGGPALAPIPGGVEGFQAAISDSYFPYEIERVDLAHDFQSAAAVGRIGPLCISRTYVSGAFNGARRLSRREDCRNAYVLMLLETGGDVCMYGKRRAVARSGDLILMNADRPLETEQRAEGVSLAISIPAPLLRSCYADLDDWCLVPLPTAEGSPAILREYLVAFWRAQSALTPVELSDLGVSLIHLIGAAFRNRINLPAFESPSMLAHFLRVRDVVAEHLAESSLDADFVADRLGISKSYLFMIMNAAENTLGRFILEERLKRSRELLADPRMIRRTISEIAFSSGFQDLSHFSRRFTERFGKSPRAFRATAIAESSG